MFRYTIVLRSYLREFTLVSKKVSNEEFNVRVESKVKGELGELTRNFNHMIKNLGKNLDEVKNKQLQLISILQSISHGILAIDIEGNIMLLNDEARRIIKNDSPGERYSKIIGKSINTEIKEPEILRAINGLFGSKQSQVEQITTDNEIVYSIKQDPVYLFNSDDVMIGFIINIEDITEKVKLENMRTDFAANVSHELRTPLTSISGFVETLKNNEDLSADVRNRFLSIIESESDRLTRLIDDILFISFLENKDGIITEKVNVYDVYQEIEDITRKSAEDKKITVNFDCTNKDLKIQCNRDYLKQVFLNLIDNAIKYTQDYGQVDIAIIDGDEMVIKVKDNGVGIPEDAIGRIFERFYRVDKARSRDVGGTGLGLAIVKHIAKSLKGTVCVESRLGEGTEFTFRVPK
jgi:two-component system phosphate regulon sensor histidine kinase PhoR